MAHPTLIENLFIKKKARNLSMFSINNNSDDGTGTEDNKIKVKFNVVFKTTFGHELKVVGNIKELGSWNISEFIPLETSPDKYPLWSSAVITIRPPSIPFVFEYKYFYTSNKKFVEWERLSNNRVAKCIEKTSRNYVHNINDEFDTFNESILKVISPNDFTKELSRIPDMVSLDVQLCELTALLLKNSMTYNTLALACITIKNLKNPGFDYNYYNPFIEWCSENITVQQTKILLSATSPTYMWLSTPTSELIDKIEAYQEARQHADNDIYHLLTLSELRIALLNEYKSSEDITGLLITDTYLEKIELVLLEKTIETISDQDTWKIIIIGMWISQLLFLQCIKPKQTSVMISQFEKLKRQESIEILRDLLNELFALVLEVYIDLYAKVNHQECEALAAILKSEYKILYYAIFNVCSEYLIKALPILNQHLLQIPFFCYSPGSCKANLRVFKGKISDESDLLIVFDDLPEDLELPSNVKGIVAINIDSLYNSTLLQAKKINIPVAIGFFPPLVESEYIVNVNEDLFTIQRA
jgi:Starch binding domain